MKIKSNSVFLQEILSNTLIKIGLVISFIFMFYVISIGLSYPIYEYFGSVILVFSIDIYFVFIYLCFFLVLTYCIYDYFKNNYLNIIRNDNKNKYYKTMYNKLFFANNVFFAIYMLSTIVVLLIFRGQDLRVLKMNYFGIYNYSISNLQYIVFVIFKYYFFCQFFSFLNMFLLILVDKKIVVLLNIFLYGLFLCNGSTAEVVTSIFKLPWSIEMYIKMKAYSSFYMEISCFFTYAMLLSIILFVIYKFVCKSKKGV